jgi:molybdopterin-containing oxidoreductase family molybdopterin binding subunit
MNGGTMSELVEKSSGLTRRNFLKTTAAVAGTAAIGSSFGCSSIDTSATSSSSSVEQIYKVACHPNCMQQCFIDAHVKEGKLVKLSAADLPDTKYNRICLRGLSHTQRVYHPERIKYPMKKIGERGEGKFERISWDEAIETIVMTFKRIQDQYGKQAIGFYSLSGNCGGLGFCLSTRFANVNAMSVFNGNVDLAIEIGLIRSLGGQLYQQTNEVADYANAKTIISWANNLTESEIQTWHFVADGIENGTKLIVIDPVFNVTASKADQWIPLKAGSDAALALSMIQVIIEEGLCDQDFLINHTVAPFLVREDTRKFLREKDLDANGSDTYIVWDLESQTAEKVEDAKNPATLGNYTINGIKVSTAFQLLSDLVQEYVPDKATTITGVDPKTIRSIARLYATNKPSSLICGFGADRYDNGYLTGHAIATLATITGNIGKPGASVGTFNRVYSMNASFLVPGTSDSGLMDQTNTVGQYSLLSLLDIVRTGSYRGEPLIVKALFIANGNLVSNSIEQNVWTDTVFPTLDLIVVADLNMNDTVMYADIVLPVAHWFESTDIVISGNSSYSMLSEKAIDPLYETKPNKEIFRLVSEGLGKGEFFTKSDEEYIEELLDVEDNKELGLSYSTLAENKAIRALPGDNFIMYEGGIFDTPSKRAEFYLETPYTYFDYGQDYATTHDYLPEFRPPHEAWKDNPLFEKYPLVYTQEHSRYRVHSQWWDVDWLHEIEGEPTIKMNTQDATDRKIGNGDYIRAFNDRGEVIVKAVVTEGICQGVVAIRKGWQNNQFIKGGYQRLTKLHINPITLNQSYNDTLVEIEKYEEV